MSKRSLVTGGAGFIGSHLVDKLINNNYDVVVIDNLLRGNKLINTKKVNFINCDIKDYNSVVEHTKNCDMIFHFAAFLGVDQVAENPLETMETETIGTFNVIQASIKNNVKKIIYASTSGVYGQVDIEHAVNENFRVSPSSSYAIAKRYNEIYLKSVFKMYNISTFSLRFFNIYGPRQDNRMVIPRFFEQAMNNKDIIVYGNGNQTRDFTFIDDTIESAIKVAEKLNGSEIINVSLEEDIKIIDLAKLIKKISNSKSEIKLVENPHFRKDYEVEKRFGSSDKLHNLINYKPNTKLAEGLLKTYNNLKI